MPDDNPNTTKSNLPMLALGGVALVATTVAVTLWLTRNGASSDASAATPIAAAQAADQGTGASTYQASDRQPVGTGVVINGRELSAEQVQQLAQMYGRTPTRGAYWYDSRSGLYGAMGQAAAGYIRPGHDFGPLSPQASNGHTGVFINGRQINAVELQFLQAIFGGQVQQGRAWLDGNTWYFGAEGNPQPIGNLAVAIQQAQQAQRGGGGGNGWTWRDGSGAGAASDGSCAMMAVPGAPVYSNGC